MTFIELLNPIKQNKKLSFFIFIFCLLLPSLALKFAPIPQKSTIYFTVKPVTTEANINFTLLDPAESTMKTAEMIAGWAKSPGFRNRILEKSETYIPHFKQKITARKQNRMNVFWTLKLNNENIPNTEKIVQAIIETIQENLEEFNAKNPFPFEITTSQIFHEKQNIPVLWQIIIGLFLALFVTPIVIFIKTAINGKVAYISQIKDIFPDSPLLQIENPIGLHDVELINQFLTSFKNPQLISSLPDAEDHFDINSIKEIQLAESSPILILQVGKTSLKEISNWEAILGGSCGIILFEK